MTISGTQENKQPGVSWMDVAVRITHLWKMQFWIQELQSQEKGNKAGFTHGRKKKSNTRNIALHDAFSTPKTVNQTFMSVLLNFHHHSTKASFPLATSKAYIPWQKFPCNFQTVPKKTIPGSSNTPEHQISSVPVTVKNKQVFLRSER